MASYAAVTSLLKTLEQLQQRNPILVQGRTAKTLESLHATAEYFQLVLDEVSCKSKRFDPEKVNSLEEKIRVAASDAEDVIELEICQIIKDLSWKVGIACCKSLRKRLLPVVENMDTEKKEVMEIVSMIRSTNGEILEYGDFCNSSMPNLEDDIVQGLDDDLEMILKRLTGPSSDLDIVTITGMGGIGKTTLARKAHDHPTIRYRFDIHVWITISQDFQNRNVLLDALHCISNVKKKDYEGKSDNELANLVQKNLKGRRYLVVVDDIWSIAVWDSIRAIFPEYNNGSRILLTTRETEVALYANPTSPHEMNLLNLDNSWKLLRDKVFGPKHDHPPELEDIGKKIVGKCQGLPLTISVIAGQLYKMARTLESWKDVAKNLGEVVASHPDKCLRVLGLSYHHLPNHLKLCFLSMAGFPEDFQVETRRLIQLWIAEGFIRTCGSSKSLEEVAEDYLKDLISRNLIMVIKRRFNGEIKACGMHDLLREFCLIEAEIINFMHVERTHDLVPTLLTEMHNVRRFSFQTKTHSVDNCCNLLPPAARSIYLFCQLWPALTPRRLTYEGFSRFNLLRVLAIFDDDRFHSFPQLITKLFHLRYLEIKCDENLPASISELQNLQTLIYERCCTDATLPGEIWMMKTLRLIHLRESCYLPGPKSFGKKHLVTGMPNLEELSILLSTSCTNEVFSLTPNLKRLIVQETPPYTNYLIDMSSLSKLEALKIITSPYSIERFVFPTLLKKLTLAGLYFTWEDMSILVKLPNLEELKLKGHATWGHEVWKFSDEDKFESLKLFLINRVNIQRWEASSDSFPNLKCLFLKNCHYLEEIPKDFGEICTLESIELHNCSTSVEDSARKIKHEQEDMGNRSLKVFIRFRHNWWVTGEANEEGKPVQTF